MSGDSNLSNPIDALIVRDEEPRDHPAIHDIIDRAFTGMPYAAGDEAELVDTLRRVGALAVSLVADLDGKVIGQIAFSPAIAVDGTQPWFALGPVAVLPEFQRSGVGGTLIRAGLERIAALGAVGCILTGNPDYYLRFGFNVSPKHAPPQEPSEFFMIKVLHGPPPVGAICFHDAFYGAG